MSLRPPLGAQRKGAAAPHGACSIAPLCSAPVEELQPANPGTHTLFEFCDLVLDPVAGRLSSAGLPVDIDPKPLGLILLLLRNRERVVPVDELMRELWPDVTVSASALASAIRDARRALGDSGSEQRVLQTQRGLGYRFVAETREKKVPLRPIGEPLRGAAPPTVAVMQFRDVGVDPSMEPLVARLAVTLKDLLDRGSGQSALGPVPLSSSPRDVGRVLGADYLILGGATQAEDGLHLSARLVETATGLHQWSEPFAVRDTGQASGESHVAGVLASSFSSQISFAEGQRAMRRPVEELSVLELVRRALTVRYETLGSGSTREAVELLSLALKKQPEDGLALATLGAMRSSQVSLAMVERDVEVLAEVEALEARAAAAAPRDPEVIGWRAGIHLNLRNFDEALRLFEECLELDPTLINFATRLGWTRVLSGKEVERGIAEIEAAMARSPRDPQAYLSYFYLGIALGFAGNLEDAAHALRQSITRFDRMAASWLALSLIRAMSGDDSRAIAALEVARAVEPTLDRERCHALVNQAAGASESNGMLLELLDSIWESMEQREASHQTE